MSIKIALDAGHGLKTAGKETPTKIKEWTLNDKVRDKVVEFLKPYDVEIIHTDNDEGTVDESLATRLSKYKNANVAAFVSIHHNAFTGKWNSATGVEVYTDKNPTSADSKLAKGIYDRLVKYTKLKGRGIKKENFTVINQNTIPAVLVEGGFMDGSKDYYYIISDEGQTAYAKAVAEGLVEFLNIPKKQNPGWVNDINGWWYRHADGSYTTNDWEKIENRWYYFDEKGYAVTGFKTIKGFTYYFAERSFGKIDKCQLIQTDKDGAIL